jgi:hypothetical protein
MPIINIGSKLDSKGFKQAETALDKLNNQSKSLAKNFGRALSTAAVLSFSKASIKAYAEDQKAATSLSKTLDNLGIGFGNAGLQLNDYISKLEKQTGILDDELRPAMDRLLRATGSITKSQDLLSLALDISAGTGKSLTQVSQSLQKAYLGQTQALGRLGVGLTKSEIASSDFETIALKLTTLFQGQATAAANTYAGSIDRLQVSVNNAKETIGLGLVEALQLATGNSGADGATTAIDKLASGISDTVVNIGYLIEGLSKIKPLLIAIGAAAAIYFLPITSAIVAAGLALASIGKVFFAPKVNKNINGVDLSPTTATMESFQKQNKIRSLADLERERAAKALAASQNKNAKAQTKAQQDNLKLSKAKAIFDMKKIQIEAALKGNLSEEDRARLLLMKAIEDENITLIDKYTKALDAAQKKTKELQSDLDRIKATTFGDPFSGWKGSIQSAIDELKTLKGDALYIAQLATPISGQYDPRVLTAGQRINSAGEYVSYNPEMAAAGMTANPYSVPANPSSTQTTQTKIEVTVKAEPFSDPERTAQTIKEVLEQSANNTGNRYGIGTGNKDVLYIV